MKEFLLNMLPCVSGISPSMMKGNAAEAASPASQLCYPHCNILSGPALTGRLCFCLLWISGPGWLKGNQPGGRASNVDEKEKWMERGVWIGKAMVEYNKSNECREGVLAPGTANLRRDEDLCHGSSIAHVSHRQHCSHLPGDLVDDECLQFLGKTATKLGELPLDKTTIVLWSQA